MKKPTEAKETLKRINPSARAREFGWRTYVKADLEQPVKIIAISRNEDVRDTLSHLIEVGIQNLKTGE